MGKRNQYYLVEREIDTNQFRLVPVENNEENSLEKIDQFTITCKNERALSQKVITDHTWARDNYEYYIVYLDPEKELQTLEVLYEPSKSIESLIEDSLEHKMKNSSREVDVILMSFLFQMKFDQNFQKEVLSGKTNIYPKFVELLKQNRLNKTPDVLEERNYLRRQGNGWILTSYPLMRNLYESLQRDKIKYPRSKEGRKKLEEVLWEKINPEYDENQMHLLDYVQNQKEEDPLSVVMYNLDDLRMEDFIKVDRDIFFQPREEITDEGVIRKLQTLLPEKMIKSFYCLLLEKRLYEQGLEDEWGKQKNGALLEATREDIKTVLETDPKALQSTYEWTKLYQKHQLGMGMNDGERIQK